MAGCKAIYGMEPDLTREVGSISVYLTFKVATKVIVLLIPTSSCDEGAHSQIEKISFYQWNKGTGSLHG